MLKKLSIPIACAVLGATQAASGADLQEGQWTTSFRIGTALIPHGTFQGHEEQMISDLGTIAPPLAGNSGTVDLHSLTFDDVFRVGPSAALEVGYRVTPTLEPFVRLNYTQFRGESTRIGTIHATGMPGALDVRADFDDLESWSLDAGARYFFLQTGSLHPYVAGYVGVDRSSALHAHIRVPGATQMTRQELLPDETRFGTGVEVGMSYDMTPATSLRFSVGADYKGSRHEQTDAYQALGIESVRVKDVSWSVPIDLGIEYRF